METTLAIAERICYRCGRTPFVFDVVQPALIRHGGYGETNRTTLAVCCTVETISSTSERPDRES